MPDETTPEEVIPGQENTQTEEDIFLASQSGEQANSEETPDPTPEELKEAVETGSVEIDGETYSLQQLRDGMLRQADYTRKTQELSTERKQLEPIKQLYDFAGKLPQEAQAELVEHINGLAAKHLGYGTGVQTLGQSAPATGTPMADKLAAANYQDEIVDVIRSLETRNNQLESALRTELPSIRGVVQELKGDTEAQAVAAQIKSEWGKDISPSELRKLSKDSGIPDMEAAWLKSSKSLLRTPVTGVPTKPKTPATEPKSFVLGPNATENDVFEALQRGELDAPK